MKPLFFPATGFPVWSEAHIKRRRFLAEQLADTIRLSLADLNRNIHWVGEVEAPTIDIGNPYDDDVDAETDARFVLDPASSSGKAQTLRPETTHGTYLIADHMMRHAITKPPFCLWQYGKSFRNEQSGAMRQVAMRYYEFYQAEFQVFVPQDTKADILSHVRTALVAKIFWHKIMQSEDLPKKEWPPYSDRTFDLCVGSRDAKEFIEVASCSERNDYPDENIRVIEFAFGMDRLAQFL